jgi:hypothetical protein
LFIIFEGVEKNQDEGGNSLYLRECGVKFLFHKINNVFLMAVYPQGQIV